MTSDESGPTGGLVDRLKGTAKQVAGTVTGNDELAREGALHHERADAVTKAAELDAQAEQEQAAADLEAREREIEIERERLAAETAADAGATQVERDRISEEQRIAAEARDLEAAADAGAAAQQATASRSEQHAQAEYLAGQVHADELTARADQAKAAAAALDDATEEIA